MIKKSVLLTALAIAGFAVTSLAQTVPNYVPSNGLVGWWPFNGNAVDESVNTNDGTVNGATLTADRFGTVNKAYFFNGLNTYIDLASAGLSSNPNICSYSVWFKTNSLYTGLYNETSVLLTKRHADNGPSWTTLQIDPNCKVNFVIDGPAFNQDVFGGQSVCNNQWQNMVCVKNQNVYSVYLNSVLLTSQTINYTHVGSTMNMHVGHHGAWNAWFNGSIDDIGIWNRALTQQEITDLYNGNICYQTITVTDTLLINTNLTGFNPVTYQNTIKIWPNPTNDHITIDNGNLANLTGHQIKISNALGQQVFQSAITQQQFYVDMSTWGGTGIYFVNLINAQGVTIETRKIVLQ